MHSPAVSVRWWSVQSMTAMIERQGGPVVLGLGGLVGCVVSMPVTRTLPPSVHRANCANCRIFFALVFPFPAKITHTLHTQKQKSGRLINRFTKDTEAVDTQLSAAVNSALSCLVSAVLAIVVVVTVSPLTVVVLVPLAVLYYRCVLVGWVLGVFGARREQLRSAFVRLVMTCAPPQHRRRPVEGRPMPAVCAIIPSTCLATLLQPHSLSSLAFTLKHTPHHTYLPKTHPHSHSQGSGPVLDHLS